MKKKFPPVVTSLKKEIVGIGLGRGEESIEEMREVDVPLYAIRNAAYSYGASYMFDGELMSQIVEEFKDDLVILPSSIHEILFMRKKDAPAVEELLCHVAQVNHDLLLPEEILSNSVYIYHRKTHLFEVISI